MSSLVSHFEIGWYWYISDVVMIQRLKLALKSSGVHAVVVMIVQTHVHDVDVAEAGLRAISVLAANAVCRAALAQAGACAVVLQVLARHVCHSSSGTSTAASLLVPSPSSPTTPTATTTKTASNTNTRSGTASSSVASATIATTHANLTNPTTPTTNNMIAKYSCSALFYLAFGSTTNAIQIKLMGGKTLLKV